MLFDIMSEKDLQRVAQQDTPSSVQVPPGWVGLVTWAVGRFGVGVMFAAVFGWWLMTVYGDLRTDASRVLSAFEKQAETNANTVAALQQLTLAVERIGTLQKDTDRNSADIQALKRKVAPP